MNHNEAVSGLSELNNDYSGRSFSDVVNNISDIVKLQSDQQDQVLESGGEPLGEGIICGSNFSHGSGADGVVNGAPVL